MADNPFTLRFRPGWRLRCVDPPIGWVRVSDRAVPTVEIRLQLTCYLTSKMASDVTVKDSQLRLKDGQRVLVVPVIGYRDEADDPIGEERRFSVGSSTTTHVLGEFATDSPEVVTLLTGSGTPVRINIDFKCNLGTKFRRVAHLDLERLGDRPAEDWIQVATGRALPHPEK